VHDQPAVTTYLFTDIEGSTRLWEQDAERMRPALARHDALARAVVDSNRGIVVKTLGDGVHAVFDDPLDAVAAGLQLQLALADPGATGGVTLRVRCGMHSGIDERRDNDFFGKVVNRAARIMGAAHGGQVLLSQTLAVLVAERLPAGIALRDLGAVRLRDLASPERVYQLVHPDLRRDFPPLRSLEATPNNLPQQLTSFIGRERELLEVKRLLPSTRLLTLLGAGGLGKTRLSLQVAADAMDDFPDGVWFVDLAPLADERLVPQAVASVLGVTEETGRPVLEALVNYVEDRQLLIVLDNCEHLMRACADVTKQLLQAGSRMKILASSREHLHVTGETTYAVPSLSVPDPKKPVLLEALTQYEAIRLFIDRAGAVQPNFKLTDDNASAVADICHRLDGIPLAIELAAGRVRALSVENVASRLHDRFRLLTRGDRTALPRQQTLRASIDWSYDLLTEPERALLRQLAVFAGGWTVEGAESVGATGSVKRADVLDLLSNLVEKSLVTTASEGDRYRLLETVREYAQERLRDAGEEDQARSRHLAFFLALAEKARPELLGPQQGTWLARLDLDRENLLSAHAWAEHAEEGGPTGLRLVCSVKHYWINRGLLGLGQRVTVEALAHPGAQERSLARCKALSDAGQLNCVMGHYGDAQRYLAESLSIAREIGDKRMVAAVLQPLGVASLGQGKSAGARGHFEEALTLAHELGNKREVAAALNALAQVHRVEGALVTAEPLYANVVELARELGDRESIAIGLLNLSMVAIGQGSTDRVRSKLLEVLAIVEEIGSKPAGISTLEVSAGFAALRGECEQAARFFGAAETQMGLTGLHRDPADEAFLAPLIATARKALGSPTFAAAEAAGRALSHDQSVAEARAWLDRCL
jgi:predicted ATPase/class 3 adenylate cyclase